LEQAMMRRTIVGLAALAFLLPVALYAYRDLHGLASSSVPPTSTEPVAVWPTSMRCRFASAA
jgi:hypothetical protein